MVLHTCRTAPYKERGTPRRAAPHHACSAQHTMRASVCVVWMDGRMSVAASKCRQLRHSNPSTWQPPVNGVTGVTGCKPRTVYPQRASQCTGSGKHGKAGACTKRGCSAAVLLQQCVWARSVRHAWIHPVPPSRPSTCPLPCPRALHPHVHPSRTRTSTRWLVSGRSP